MSSKDAREDAEFLARYDPADFERPSVAVDVALISVLANTLVVLVMRRTDQPYRNQWALPGGFVGITEPVEVAAQRVLHHKVGIKNVFIEQLYTFSAIERDPRMRIISVAHLGLVPPNQLTGAAQKTGLAVAELHVDWSGETGGAATILIDGQPAPLAFDHADMLGLVVQRLRGKLKYTTLAFEMLPASFRLRDLQAVHEGVNGQPTNKDSFRRRMLASGQIEPTGAREAAVGHRPAALYRWVKKEQ